MWLLTATSEERKRAVVIINVTTMSKLIVVNLQNFTMVLLGTTQNLRVKNAAASAIGEAHANTE